MARAARTDDELNVLRAMGADHIQGFYSAGLLNPTHYQHGNKRESVPSPAL